MGSIDELFAEVYANPEDEQLRRVLADALMAANDPRGELILFQLEPDKDHHRRAMRLIQAHGISWLGALRGQVIPTAYERGFLASCVVIADDVPACPEWATVHTIELDGSITSFELHPEMRSLRTLALGKHAAVLGLLADRTRTLLASVEIRITWEPMLELILRKHLSRGVGRLLIVEHVAPSRADTMQALARTSSSPVELRVDPVVHEEPEDHFEAIDE